MIVLVSLIVLLRGFTIFLHGASHPYIPIHPLPLFRIFAYI